MPADLPLHPDVRALYGVSLRPPPGAVFDAGLATSFSLDFETGLAIPVTLALFASENRDELMQSPLALLEGLERTADRLAIFCEAGRIQAQPVAQSRLCTLLERMIIEVTAPRGGSFHPKLWVLRYRSIEPGKPILMRLLVLSRNLTRDRSWDTSLCLDGEVGRGRRTINRPVVNLLQHLPSWATGTPPEHLAQLVTSLQNDLHRTNWTMPEPFEEISFAINGIGRRPWKPKSCTRLGVVSPFCDTIALEMLADLADEPIHLVSKSEELVSIDPLVRGRFAEVSVMDELAQTEDNDDNDDEIVRPLSGLHAKIFLQEIGMDHSITVGSGNATGRALRTRRNVEVFATLTGKRSKVGEIAKILGPEGFGRVLRPFQPAEVSEIDGERREAERRIELARREVAGAGLTLRCRITEGEQDGKRLWKLLLQPNRVIKLDSLATATSWPITRGETHARDVLAALRAGTAVEISILPLEDISRFLAFRLIDSTHPEAQAIFALGLKLTGLPAHRHQAVLKWLLNSEDDFRRYLRLLLADMDDPLSSQFAASSTGGGSNWSEIVDDEPILEEMVRALSRGRDRLTAVKRLMERLTRSPDDNEVKIVPAEFFELWKAFRPILEERDRTNG